ncbi:unnamed protein product [Mycena citricolor]|uniref:F-box domain-containing protein n=1 Tax=Mycena citricolor TaxID=2018698 RepID=A0AAD2I0B9_9AGAR|nr:unnamed protein product [Mycena citricolor]
MTSIDIQLRLREIPRKIAALEWEIITLRAERQTLLPFYTPILLLPAELTSEIFQWSTQDEESCGKGMEQSMRLSGVCRAWRDVAIWTPQLWTRFDVSLFIANPAKLDEFVGLCISRAGSLSLELSVSFSWTPPSSQIINVVQVVARHSTRWRALTFEDLLPNALSVLPSGITWPSLERLSISAIFKGEILTPFEAFQNSPALRTVRLAVLDDTHLLLPWSQLHHLTLIALDTDACVRVLRRTTGLQTLTCRSRLALPVPVELVTLPDLVQYHSLGDNLGPTAYLILPALQYLTIENLELVPGLLERSSAARTLIALTVSDTPTMDQLKRLPRLPSTKHLTIKYFSAAKRDVCRKFIQALNYRVPLSSSEKLTVIFPVLETLTLHNCWFETLSVEEVAEMVKRRFPETNGSLRSISVDFMGPTGTNVLKAVDDLREMRHQGLELNFSWSDEPLCPGQSTDFISALSDSKEL